MGCFKVERTDKVNWSEDYSMVVTAQDKLHAERRARLSSSNFRKAKLRVTEIDTTKEQCVLIANKGV